MSGGISANKLNDISKVYLDMVTNINKKEQEADAKRWTQKEETGCKTESPFKKKKVKEDYESQKKKEVLAAMKKQGRKLSAKDKNKIADKVVKDKGDTSKSDDRYAYESFSNWRTSLREVTSDKIITKDQNDAARRFILLIDIFEIDCLTQLRHFSIRKTEQKKSVDYGKNKI